MEIKGKTVLITGAARRIGREIALTLARRGAFIVIHYRESRKEALALQKEIQRMGSKAYAVHADFAAGNDVSKTVALFLHEVYTHCGRVDVLVNNASIFYPTPLEKISEKDWDEFMGVNLKVPFFLASAVGLMMRKQKSGKIINIVDWTGKRPLAEYLPYCISKAGLIAATKGLAKALAPQIQVAGIAPGPILPAKGASKKQQKKAADRALLKRYGSPQDIARAVQFLIEGSDFITGSILSVEGGAALN